jgi:hypothetical protein
VKVATQQLLTNSTNTFDRFTTTHEKKFVTLPVEQENVIRVIKRNKRPVTSSQLNRETKKQQQQQLK